MYQKIHEQIAVAGVYKNSGFSPKKFKWNQKVYLIDQVTLKANLKDGGVKKQVFSVTVGANVYRLLFNQQEEKWWLEEIWME